MKHLAAITFLLCSAACGLPHTDLGRDLPHSTNQYDFDGVSVFMPDTMDPNEVSFAIFTALGYATVPVTAASQLVITFDVLPIGDYDDGHNSTQAGNDIHVLDTSAHGCISRTDLAHALTEWATWSGAASKEKPHLAGAALEAGIRRAQENFCTNRDQPATATPSP